MVMYCHLKCINSGVAKILFLLTCCKLLERVHKLIVSVFNTSQFALTKPAWLSLVILLSMVFSLSCQFKHNIASALNSHDQLDAIFIDYSKAFDLAACHEKLM